MCRFGHNSDTYTVLYTYICVYLPVYESVTITACIHILSYIRIKYLAIIRINKRRFTLQRMSVDYISVHRKH